jgi:hypothetical protein
MFANPNILPLQEGILRQAYVDEGKIEAFNADEQLRFFPQWSSVIGTINLLQHDNVGAAFYCGAAFYAARVYPEIGIRTGAFQIGACGPGAWGGWLTAGCDYCMFGEELFALGAYLSEDEQQLRSVETSDWIKGVTLLVMIIGIIATWMGSTVIKDLIGA